MPITAPEGYLDISNATLRGSEIITTSNVGIMNANPTVSLSVGSNLHVNAYSSNVLEVNGNVVAEGLKLGFIEILPSYDLAAVSNVGNVTQSTIQFSNATTAFVTTANVEVGGEMTVSANVEVGGEMTVSANVEVGTANLFVDTTTGNVGVGTTSPQKTLEVVGSMRIADGLSNMCDFSVGAGTGEWDTGTKIVASDVQRQDNFGASVDISGDGNTAIVGAYIEDGTSPDVNFNSGAAYIFTKSGGSWDSGTKIEASDAQTGDLFGQSVSISNDGNTAIMGAPYEDGPPSAPVGDSGSAYIFTRTNGSWDTGTKIRAPDPGPTDHFGYSVPISGDGNTAIVGARQDDGPPSAPVGDSGSAYIFTKTNGSWDNGTKIEAPDPGPNDGFGWTVSISNDGNTAIVGARTEDGPSPSTNFNSGAAYIFTRTSGSWDTGTKIVASDPAPAAYFGISVAISGDGNTAIAGAYYDDGPPSAPMFALGAAYIFTKSNGSWDNGTKIVASDQEQSDLFGVSVSISDDGNTAIVGSRNEDGPLSAPVAESGAVYIFTRTDGSWDTGTKIRATDPGPCDILGVSVAISGDGNTLIAGAVADDGTSPDTSFNSGAAYIFERDTAAALTVSGSITANGTLLSFTGQHICFPEGPMGQDLVVSANKNKYVSLNGSLTTGTRAIKSSQALPVVSLSNVVNDRSVFGVVDHFEQSGTTRSQTSGGTVITQDKESGDNRVVVNSLGEGAIWVANTNGNVVSGDFLTTSHLPGYAQRQEGHIFKSYTVAKSTMDCDFEPEDLPVQVILKDDDDNNVLDSYGRLQWVDSDRTEPEYRIRYLDVSGTPTDEANAVHKAAYGVYVSLWLKNCTVIIVIHGDHKHSKFRWSGGSEFKPRSGHQHTPRGQCRW